MRGVRARPVPRGKVQRTSLAVVVPTYGRPTDLARCLDGLAVQDRTPDQIIVVVRLDDEPAHDVLARRRGRVGSAPLRVVPVDRPGQMWALHEGLAEVREDVVAFTDDDAVPRPDWVERMSARFDDPSVGAVGGRDIIAAIPDSLTRVAQVVGKVSWFGRATGNHHLHSIGVREVDCLKGVNLAFRRSVGVQIPLHLRGDAYWNELDLCFQVARAGFRILWDPEIIVDHAFAPRPDGDRGHEARREDHAFNYWTIMRANVPPPRRWAIATWSWLIGDRVVYGLGRMVYGWIRERGEPHARRFVLASVGRWRAQRTPRT